MDEQEQAHYAGDDSTSVRKNTHEPESKGLDDGSSTEIPLFRRIERQWTMPILGPKTIRQDLSGNTENSIQSQFRNAAVDSDAINSTSRTTGVQSQTTRPSLPILPDREASQQEPEQPIYIRMPPFRINIFNPLFPSDQSMPMADANPHHHHHHPPPPPPPPTL
jgi:hypothetical protein